MTLSGIDFLVVVCSLRFLVSCCRVSLLFRFLFFFCEFCNFFIVLGFHLGEKITPIPIPIPNPITVASVEWTTQKEVRSVFNTIFTQTRARWSVHKIVTVFMMSESA